MHDFYGMVLYISCKLDYILFITLDMLQSIYYTFPTCLMKDYALQKNMTSCIIIVSSNGLYWYN